jgi:hypothetical protein
LNPWRFITHSIDQMDREARESELRVALERARIAFLAARPEEKQAAKERYEAVLEKFTAFVLRAGHKDRH